MTRVITVDYENPQPDLIALAAHEILNGKLVAFPTETVYGLGANALEASAVARIFEVKGRPVEDPLIVHLASTADLPIVACQVPSIAYTLAQVFWPGPLTLVLPKQDIVPMLVTAGHETVAVRIPCHPVALALMRACGVPIAAPSANRFGRTSPTTAWHVLDDLGGKIDLILDAGPTTVGVESTVLDVTQTPPVILRPGGVTREALEALLGPVAVHGEKTVKIMTKKTALPSPGMLDKHYAPLAKLILFMISDTHKCLDVMAKSARQELAKGIKVGLLLADEDRRFFNDLPVSITTIGSLTDREEIARNLFDGLRRLDGLKVEVILARDFGEAGLGLAIRDRLRRAASRVITE